MTTFARTTNVLLGTDETTGATIANNATSSSSELDAGNNSKIVGYPFAKWTSTVTAGSVDVSFPLSSVAGQSYTNGVSLNLSVAPINGTLKEPGISFAFDRFVTGSMLNNATGANITNALLRLNTVTVTN